MGTRSTTLFINRYRDSKTNELKEQKVCKIYRQMDGYPDGHGLDLAKFLNTGVLVNGISFQHGEKRQFNGMGCLAASVVAELKTGPGGIYMIPITAGGQEYNYKVIADETAEDKARSILIRVSNSNNRKIFEGTPEEFIQKFGSKKK
jgi:hypothetical protein